MPRRPFLNVVAIGLAPLFAVSFDCRAEQAPQDPSIACLKALQLAPAYQPLKGLVDVSGTHTPTQQMLASPRIPSERERAAITALTADSEDCWRQGEAWRTEHWPPEVAALFAQYAGIAKGMLTELAAGGVSYGDFAQSKAAAITRFRKQLREILERLKAQRGAQEAQGTAAGAAPDDAARTEDGGDDATPPGNP